MFKPAIAFRPATETDMPYILSSWLPTYVGNQPSAVHVATRATVISILERYGAVIACDPEDPEQIYGYAVANYINDRDVVLYWIQVKRLYKGLDIGNRLFQFIRDNRDGLVLCPFWRKKLKSLAAKHNCTEALLLLPRLLEQAVNTPATILFKD